MRKGGYACPTCGVKLHRRGKKERGTPKDRCTFVCPQCDKAYNLPRPPTREELMRLDDDAGAITHSEEGGTA